MNELKFNQKRYDLYIPETSTLEEVIHVLNNLSLEYNGDEKEDQFKQLEKFLVEKKKWNYIQENQLIGGIVGYGDGN